MIDICDFAVGLSRQLYGLTIASERPQHRMMEQWHPLGVVGIITAFNFPVAVWSWNSALAAVCGDATLWKPSSQTPLTAIATIKIAERICRANKVNPAIFSLVIGDGATVGERLISDAAHSARLRDRLDKDGPPRGGGRRAPLGPLAARIGRQQRHYRHADGRPGPGHARHPVRRGRHRRPALHDHPPHHPPRVIAREPDSAAGRCLQAGPHRQPARARHAHGAAHQHAARSQDMQAALAAGAQGGRANPLWRRAAARARVSRRLLRPPVPRRRPRTT